jgi:hypothetical protein
VRAEQLVALAGAHGVDFVRVARMAPSRSPATKLLAPRTNGAHAKETRSAARPEWTLAELAQAAAGVPQIPFMAACFAFAGAHDDYWRLHAALFDAAIKLRRVHKWPAQVASTHRTPIFYLENLAQLVLDEDAHPALFRACPQLPAICLGISVPTWDKSVAERYGALQYVWLGWLGHAAAIMQPRLAGEED